MIKQTALVAVLALLSACSSAPSYIEIPSQPKKVVGDKVSPILKKDNLAESGSVILSKETGHVIHATGNVVTLTSDIVYLFGNNPGLKAGSKAPLGKSSTGANAACFNEALYDQQQTNFCLFDEDGDGVFEIGSYLDYTAFDISASYQVDSKVVGNASESFIKQTLSYKGLKDKKLTFNYAEYRGDSHIAIVSQDFQINFQKGVHIGFNFKGAELVVKDANNLSIIYSVEKAFD